MLSKPARVLIGAPVVTAGILLVAACGSTTSATTPSAGGSLGPSSSSASSPSSSTAPGPSATPNGIENKSAAQIAKIAQANAIAASAVRMVGGITEEGATIAIAASVEKGVNGVGTITVDGVPLQVIKIGNTAYFKGNATIFSAIYGAKTGKSVGSSKWLKVTTSEQQLGQLAGLIDLKGIFADSPAQDATMTKTGTATILGQPVVIVHDPDPTEGGDLYVATTGEALPVRLTAPPGQKGQFDFSNWNVPVTVTAPPASDTVTLS